MKNASHGGFRLRLHDPAGAWAAEQVALAPEDTRQARRATNMPNAAAVKNMISE
jgi:hypothetical protein